MSETTLRRYTSDAGRVYVNAEGQVLPSVTTVWSHGEEPKAVQAWKARNDGTDGRPDWREILGYTRARGIMLHHQILSKYAADGLEGGRTSQAEATIRAAGNQTRYDEEAAFVETAWAQLASHRGITTCSVLAVESFVSNPSVGYAGQFDLMDVEEDLTLVLVDIKTGRAVYEKDKVQLVAYAAASRHSPDRLEVLRVDPDQREWEVSDSDSWAEERQLLWGKFLEARAALGDITELAARIMDDSLPELG